MVSSVVRTPVHCTWPYKETVCFLSMPPTWSVRNFLNFESPRHKFQGTLTRKGDGMYPLWDGGGGSVRIKNGRSHANVQTEQQLQSNCCIPRHSVPLLFLLVGILRRTKQNTIDAILMHLSAAILGGLPWGHMGE